MCVTFTLGQLLLLFKISPSFSHEELARAKDTYDPVNKVSRDNTKVKRRLLLGREAAANLDRRVTKQTPGTSLVVSD